MRTAVHVRTRRGKSHISNGTVKSVGSHSVSNIRCHGISVEDCATTKILACRFDAVSGPGTCRTILNGNSTRFAVGQTVRFNGFCRAIWDVRLFVPSKVHRHHRIDQGFPPRHRAVHLTSRVAQGSVWRGQLHPWIYVEVGGKS